MGYLNDFRWDVFLSYAHVDNAKTAAQSRGWVTRFRDELYDALQKRAKEGEVTVFWDPRLRANQRFGTALQAAIERSALLVVLTSRRYLNSQFCKREAEWFCQKAAESSYGLVLKSDLHEARIFNVRLFDIPHPEWFSQLRGMNAYSFFEPARLESPEQPLHVQRLSSQVQQLAEDIITTLERMRSTEAEPGSGDPPSVNTFSVYVAKVHGSLVPHQEEVLELLKAKKVNILGPALTEDLARQDIAKSRVSVHLLNGFADFGVERQLELGKNAPRQIIWLSRQVDLRKSDLSSYEQRLLGLENDAGGDRNYEFMRGENFGEDIVGAITTLKYSWDARDQTQDLFIDVRDNDQSHAVQLFDYLSSQAIPSTSIQRYQNQPTDKAFREHVRRAKAIVFFYGSINKETLEGRLNSLTEIASTRSQKIDMIGVFAAPPPVKKLEDIQPVMPLKITWMNNTEGFDPGTLGALLDLFKQAPQARQ